MERRRDELGELVRDFNQMADRIESLVRGQRQLISDISHELRSPLARLNVALGLARQRATAEAAAPLDRIEREAERLNELIGKLLTLARMQDAAGPPEVSRVDLRNLLAEVAEDAEFEAQERGCSVRLTEVPASDTVKSTAKSCNVSGSPELLRSAVENVVRNAVRYTAEGSEIQIELTCTDGWARVRVSDHGPGVPEGELNNLFRPFYRVADARDRRTGGTGLGLAITDRAVRLHGGTVRAENLRQGGLMVEIQLPVANGLPPAGPQS
jgi:two-component system sensor histidine kinase CpxA